MKCPIGCSVETDTYFISGLEQTKLAIQRDLLPEPQSTADKKPVPEPESLPKDDYIVPHKRIQYPSSPKEKLKELVLLSSHFKSDEELYVRTKHGNYQHSTKVIR